VKEKVADSKANSKSVSKNVSTVEVSKEGNDAKLDEKD
jgi:hypothetical protein